MLGVTLPAWLTAPQFIAGTAAAFIAAFAGAALGYWLTEKSARRARAIERRGRIAATSRTALSDLQILGLGESQLPKAASALKDPSTELILLSPGLQVATAALRNSIDLPGTTGAAVRRTFESYTRLGEAVDASRKVAEMVVTPAGGLWVDRRAWESADTRRPEFVAAFAEVDRARQAFSVEINKAVAALLPLATWTGEE